VNLFILINILLLLAFTAVLTVFSFIALAQQSIHLNHPTLIGFIVGLVVMTLISVLLIWVYYRIVYGIILKRLGKNLTELQKIDNQEL
jgi:membrane protein implicated in regulation of membrane protease activity